MARQERHEFSNGGFPGVSAAVRVEQLLRERRRIEGLLVLYVGGTDARTAACIMHVWAVELDEITRTMLNNRQVAQKFRYDGTCFITPDGNRPFALYVSYDGLHFLRALDEGNMRVFFDSGMSDGSARSERIQSLLAWVEKHFVQIPRWRLQNLNEDGHIGLIHPNAIAEAVQEHVRVQNEIAEEARLGLLASKDDFWKRLEEEMKHIP